MPEALDRRRSPHPDGPLPRRARRRPPRRPRRARDRRGRRAHRDRPGRGRATSTGAPRTRRARTTATSPGWRRCSPGCRSRSPGVTVNRLCASGLEAVNQASRALRLGEGDLYLAGGVGVDEPRALGGAEARDAGSPRGPQTMHDTALGWRLVNPRMAERYSTEAMGETAENVAERYAISREDQDAFALRSHQRAVAAAGEGRFDDEIVAGRGAARAAGRRPGDGRGRRGPARRHVAREARASCGPPSARAAPSPPATPRP